MSEDLPLDLQLSEEQLSAITGGCAQCDDDHAQANALLNRATTSASHALQARLDGRFEDERRHLADKQRILAEAQSYVNRIAIRHGYGLPLTIPVPRRPR